MSVTLFRLLVSKASQYFDMPEVDLMGLTVREILLMFRAVERHPSGPLRKPDTCETIKHAFDEWQGRMTFFYNNADNSTLMVHE